MDSMVSETKSSRPLRRSTRQASVKVLGVEPTPRGPLKRTKRGPEKKSAAAAVNGSKDAENDSDDDDESPSKKSRLDAGESKDGRGDENEMDVQEQGDEDMEKNEEQDMDLPKDSSHGTHKSKTYQDIPGDVILFPRVVLGERCAIRHTVNEDQDMVKLKKDNIKPATKFPAAPTKPSAQIRPPATRREVLNPRIPSKAEYRRTMELKARDIEISGLNHRVPSTYAASNKSYITRQHVNNIPPQKEPAHHKQKEEKTRKNSVAKENSQNSSSGCLWYLWYLMLLVLLSSATLLAYKVIQRKTGFGRQVSKPEKLETFATKLSLLEAQFPSQRPELWQRSKVHLEKHLKTAHPTEPVSLILTAGLKTERTLGCMAQALASSFSSTLNGSVLHIDGTSKASKDSDEVKLDIDSQLRAAFEGETPVAVIHRFEELPPGSTLIFYRYCDHENAAYKRVFLLFTVLLPQDEVSSELSLKEVEELVQDYVKEKLVSSSNQAAFNNMDLDKFGGLWSRISHLILPVVSEGEVEEKGC